MIRLLAAAAAAALLLLTAAAAAGDAREVTGRVLGADGAPLAGARVDLLCFDMPRGYAESGGRGTAAPVATATTDADGRYALAVPAAAASVHVGVRADGCSPGWCAALDVASGGAEQDFRLQPTVTVTGRVTDARTLQGIEGATVSVGPWLRHDVEGWRRWTWFVGRPDPTFTAETDANGRFMIPDLPAGAYTATATHADHEPADPGQVQWAQFPTTNPARTLDVRLRRRSTRSVEGVDRPAGALRLLGSPHTAPGIRVQRVAVVQGGSRILLLGADANHEVDVPTGGYALASPETIVAAGITPRLLAPDAQRGAGAWVTVESASPHALTTLKTGAPALAIAELGGDRGAVALADGRLALVDLVDPRVTHVEQLADTPLSALVPAARGTIAAGTWQQIVVYDPRRQRVERRIDALASQVLELAADDRAERLVASGIDQVAVVDAGTGEVLDSVDVAGPTPVAIAADGSRFAYRDGDHVVLREVAGGSRAFPVEGDVQHIRVLPDAVAVITAETGLHLFDAATGADRIARPVHAGNVYRVDAAPAAEGRALVATLSRDAVAVWDARTGQLVRRESVVGTRPREVRLSADGALLHVQTGRGTWISRLTSTGEEVDAPAPPERDTQSRSPDGRLLLSQMKRRSTFEVVRADTGAPVFRLPDAFLFAACTPAAMAFDADGDVVTACGAGAVVWDTGRLAD